MRTLLKESICLLPYTNNGGLLLCGRQGGQLPAGRQAYTVLTICIKAMLI